MKKCHPMGYALRGVGELIGILGLLSLLGVIGWLIFASERSWFSVMLNQIKFFHLNQFQEILLVNGLSSSSLGQMATHQVSDH